MNSLPAGENSSVLALSGGIGGAKLALGLYRVMPPGRLTVVTNTGDDFEHFGLTVCPDTDTVMYTLAGICDLDTGWGRAQETWSFMQAVRDLGGDSWFQLGDRDLATNVLRSHALGIGRTLSEVTAEFCQRLGINARILPMSDDPVRTQVETPSGNLAFQEYFVRDRCEPPVAGFRFAGAEQAVAQPAFLQLLADPSTAAVVICPSNPYISIDPMLALPGVRDALKAAAAPVIAVSPIVGGQAIKGPTAKMMTEQGLVVSAYTVAEHYTDFIDGFVLDSADAELADQLSMDVHVANTIMTSLAEREQLAREVLAFAQRLRSRSVRSRSGSRSGHP